MRRDILQRWMRTSGLLLLASVLIGSLAGVAHAMMYEVSIVDYTYRPDSVTVAVGDSIRWTNNGSLPHTVTSGTGCSFDGDFDSGTLNPGQTYIYVTDIGDAGLTKPYFCRFHCFMGMTGSYSVLNPTPTLQGTWGHIKNLYR